MYQYIITPTAQRQLDYEIGYSKKHWGVAHGNKYKHEIMKHVRNIAKQPKLYPLKPEFGNDVRGMRYKGNYILYSVDERQKLIIIAGFPSIYKQK